MTITITIPDDIATTVIDNICVATNYDGVGGGKEKILWVKEKMIIQLKTLNQMGAMKIVVAKQQADTVTIF